MTDLGSARLLLPPLPDSATAEERAAHRQRWLDLRRPGIGASEIAALLGLSPWSSRFSLWWTKREGWEMEQTEAQEWGLRSEPMIAEKFAEVHPELVVSQPGLLYQHRRHPFMMCSPDRIAFDRRGRFFPVELKNDDGPAWVDDVPLHYRAQVIWQCAVLGAPAGWLVRLSRKKYTEHRVKAGSVPHGRLDDWIRAAAEFMDSLAGDEPPDVDGHHATTDALEALYPDPNEKEPPVRMPDEWADEFDGLLIAEGILRKQKEALKNRIRAKLGNATDAIDSEGRVFARRTIAPRRGYTVAPSIVDKLERKTRHVQREADTPEPPPLP